MGWNGVERECGYVDDTERGWIAEFGRDDVTDNGAVGVCRDASVLGGVDAPGWVRSITFEGMVMDGCVAERCGGT